MFEISGIPAHPLFVHAAAVFVPLFALAVLVFVLIPGLRQRIGWVVVGLAVIAPGSALIAKETGENLLEHRFRGATSGLEALLRSHERYANASTAVTFLLGVLMLLLVLRPSLAWRRGAAGGTKPLALLLSAGAVALALAVIFLVYKTGDTGAQAVWLGR